MKPVYFVVLPLMLAFIILTILWSGAVILAYVDPASLAFGSRPAGRSWNGRCCTFGGWAGTCCTEGGSVWSRV
jgi:hypothetical protein